MNVAASAYASTARAGLTGRALEAAVFNRCATELHRAAAMLPGDSAPLVAALERNRRAWRIILDEILDPENPLPDELRELLRQTAGFVFARTAQLAGAPVPAGVAALVTIDRQLASWLEAPASAAQAHPILPRHN
jgi:flagellar protein FlaF